MENNQLNQQNPYLLRKKVVLSFTETDKPGVYETVSNDIEKNRAYITFKQDEASGDYVSEPADMDPALFDGFEAAPDLSIADDDVIINQEAEAEEEKEEPKRQRRSFKSFLRSLVPTKRRLIQVYSALLFNANLKGYIQGGMFEGSAKVICSPGINCYSCPGAIGTCPLGALQQQLGGKSFPFYILGIIFLYALMFGRTICGWMCPVGLIQDLLHKIKTPKLKKSVVSRTLSYFKYVVLVLFVFILAGFGIYPAFCKYICPAGILEGAFGLLPQNDWALLSSIGSLFTWKFALLISIFVACIFIYRAFCRFICPLGAIYSLFNRFSFFGIKLNRDKCTNCGKCISKCKLDIKHVGDHECISCGECIDVCPTKAITFKGTKVFLMPNELKVPNNASEEEKEEIKAKHASKEKKKLVVRIISGVLVSIILALVLVGALVYYNVIDNDELWNKGTEQPIEQEPDAGTKVGNKLPSMEIQVFDENGLKTEYVDPSKNEGKVVVINFWGIWCKPCLEELPHFNEVAADTYGNDVVFYAIHYDDSFQKGVEYVASNYSDSTMIFAKDTENSDYLRLVTGTKLPAYPHTIVLDKDGVITYTSGATLTKSQLLDLIKAARDN